MTTKLREEKTDVKFANDEKQIFESGYTYTCTYIPTSEDWYVIGFDPKRDRLCVAGYPPTIAKISDCTDFVKLKQLTSDEINYRTSKFGQNWL